MEEPELEEDATLVTTFAAVLALLGFLGDFFSVVAGRFRLVALPAGGFARELLAKEVLPLLGTAAELLEAAPE